MLYQKQLEGLKWKDKRIYHIMEIKNENLQKEIYGFVDDRCKRLAITTVVGDIYKFDLLVEFLNSKCLELKSITDRPIDDLKRSYKAFLYQKGLSLRVNRSRKDRQTEGKQDSANISYLNMLYSYVTEQKNISIPENEKDVWDMRKLDIVPRSNPIRGRYRLDFRDIQQKEFKEIAKINKSGRKNRC